MLTTILIVIFGVPLALVAAVVVLSVAVAISPLVAIYAVCTGNMPLLAVSLIVAFFGLPGLVAAADHKSK